MTIFKFYNAQDYKDESGWALNQAATFFFFYFYKILQNEQLDEISPLGNEEVSAVSQAWFTTKEDKDSLTNKGKIYCEFQCPVEKNGDRKDLQSSRF